MPDNPTLPSGRHRGEDGVIALHIGQGGGNGNGLFLDTWKTYSFNSHFLTPTDGWSFTLGDEEISDELRIAIAPRQQVSLLIGEQTQCTGIVDKVTTTSSRLGGTELTVEGRDRLSPAVDSVIDPRVKFTPEMNVLDLLRGVFGPFGFSEESQFLIDNTENLGVMTGNNHRTRSTTKQGKPLKDFALHLLKPECREGAFAFAARVAQRFGLWLWLTADGNHIVCAKPNFEQTPDFKAIHRRDGGQDNNILTSVAMLDASTQPSIIFASASGTGGENSAANYTVCVVNPMIQTDNTTIFKAYPNTKPLDLSYLGPSYRGNGKDTSVYNATGGAYVDTFARPLFLVDDKSKTIEELENFLKRELALRMHKSFTYTFEVVGHEYTAIDGAKVPWAVDTIVTVDDDYANVHEDLWIMERTFTKSRQGGTKTKLTCIRPHTLEF